MMKKNKLIYKFIKTECGRSKYESLIVKKGTLNKLRLIWFIVIATMRDLHIRN